MHINLRAFFKVGCVLAFLTNGWATAPIAPVKSVHYKLAVGQGECATTLSTLRSGDVTCKFAVTADIGSSSMRADPKYALRYNYAKMMRVIKRTLLPSTQSGAAAASACAALSAAVSGFSPPDVTTSDSDAQTGSQSSDSLKATSLTGEAILDGSFPFLVQQLKDVLCWVVFLSHPDKDHINYLSATFEAVRKVARDEKIASGGPKMLLVAGGEWKNSNSTQEIREVLALQQSYPSDIVSIFPYEDARLNAQETDAWLKKQPYPIQKDNPRSWNPKKPVNGQDLEAFHGTLFDCLNCVYPREGEALSRMLFPDERRFSPGAAQPEGDIWALFEEQILKKIYIWSLDYRTGSANAQSLVWSHAVDDLGWTFVYTGDAEERAFQKMSSVLSWHMTTPAISPTASRRRAPAQEASALAVAQGRPRKGAKTTGAQAGPAEKAAETTTLDDSSTGEDTDTTTSDDGSTDEDTDTALDDASAQAVIKVVESWERAGENPSPIDAWDVKRRGIVKLIQKSQNLVMLHGMHHGSKENFSELAMRLFKPEACYFSAGNGASFAHPHADIIRKYRKYMHSRAVWASYTLDDKRYGFAAFNAAGSGPAGTARKFFVREGRPLLLCPNLYGTIKIDEAGFWIPHDSGHAGYIMYDLHHAYHIQKDRFKNETFCRIKDLVPAHTDGAYAAEAFWGILAGKTLTQDEQDPDIYEILGSDRYKLMRVSKTVRGSGAGKREAGPYFYFYVLEKMDEEEEEAQPSARPAESARPIAPYPAQHGRGGRGAR